jgi:hypothetical protein
LRKSERCGLDVAERTFVLFKPSFFATLHVARHTRSTVAKSAKKRFASDF